MKYKTTYHISNYASTLRKFLGIYQCYIDDEIIEGEKLIDMNRKNNIDKILNTGGFNIYPPLKR